MLELAARRNPNVERIISIDAFCQSNTLKTFDDVEANIQDLRDNLACFGCGEKVTIVVAGQEDWDLIDQSPISMLGASGGRGTLGTEDSSHF